jgi:glycosyltransferase involved in cell wall biosynthesis
VQISSEMSLPKTSGDMPPAKAASTLRVLNLHSGNLFGGVETMMLTQVRHQESCPELESSFALCFAGRFSEELVSAGASVYQLGGVRISRPLSVRRARRNLRDLLRRKTFDVVVTHSAWTQAVFGPAVRAVGVPLVSYLHAPPDGRHWLERLARRTAPELALCNSAFTAETAGQLYPGVRSEIVYCSVAASENSSSEVNRKLIRAEFQTPEDATVIIQVSRMEPWKGQAEHLQGLSLLTDLPGWVCWQVGGAQSPAEEKYLRRLKELATSLGIGQRVRFLDQRRDVARLLAAADIFCQPNSGPEPFGITFIEALYAGLPVVTTDIGGAREILDDSCGLLVPPGDAQSLATALRNLVQAPALRTQLGIAGPARARVVCDPATQINQFYQALRSATV